jgi:hypothetical protein
MSNLVLSRWLNGQAIGSLGQHLQQAIEFEALSVIEAVEQGALVSSRDGNDFFVDALTVFGQPKFGAATILRGVAALQSTLFE